MESSRQKSLDKITLALTEQNRKTWDSLTEEERTIVRQALKELSRGEASRTLEQLYKVDYERTPPTPDQFFNDPFYLEKHGKDLFPIWKKELNIALTNPEIYELALTGAIGVGKSTAACCAIAYKLCTLSCLKNPQQFYGLMEGSMIAFGLFSLFKYKVSTTTWHMLNTMIRDSTYFKKHFSPDPKKTKDLYFPKGVYVATGATELHAIGENLFSFAMDEADFMKEASTSEQRGQAADLHQAVKRRIESRFGQKERMPPGLIILMSSKRTVDSYIERYVEDHRKDKTVHVVDLAIWQAKPDKYPTNTFRVWLGDGLSEARILKDKEISPPTGQVINPPDAPQIRKAFEEDPIAAARDMAGISSAKSYRFIMNSELVARCIDDTRHHPFDGEHVTLDYKSNDIIEDFLKHSELFRVEGSRYKPKLHPDTPRFVHVDIGLSNDCAGIAMAHYADAQSVTRFNVEGGAYRSLAPEIYVDFMLRIKPPKGSQIDLAKIRQFIVMLSEYGFQIKLITYDGYQSAEGIQALRKMGFNAQLQSVDKEPTPYHNLRQAITEGRLKYYKYVPFLDEVLNLQEDPKTRKIDHPKAARSIVGGVSIVGSKDVSDAVAACIYHIMNDETLLIAKEDQQTKAVKKEPLQPDPNDISWVVGDKKSGDNRIVGIR